MTKEKFDLAGYSRSLATAVAVGAGAMLAAAPAQAAIDVSDVVTEITATVTPIGAIGVAVLGVVVAIAAFGWVRRAIRG